MQLSWKKWLQDGRSIVLNLLIGLVTVVMITVFAGNIISIDKQMKQLPKAMTIDAMITNLNGSISAGLKIREKHIDAILASEYIVDPLLGMQLRMGFGSFGMEDGMGKLNYSVVGANCIKAVQGMKEDEFHIQQGIMTESQNAGETAGTGAGNAGDDSGQILDDVTLFFQSSDRVCVMDENLMNEKGLQVGDSVTLTMFYYRFGDYNNIYSEPLETNQYRIVGTMNILEYLGDGGSPDLIVPYEAVRARYYENDLVFYTDSCSFTVKDPYQLNDLKKEMHDIGLLPVFFASEFHYEGDSLTIRDETFIRSAEQLMKSRRLLFAILPFLIIAVFSIGFVMAQLLMKSKTPEYAIMRSLGQNHGESLYRLVKRYMASAMAGSIIGIGVGILILNAAWYAAVTAALLFIVCYLIGTLVSMSALKKISIMAVLSKND